MKILYGSPLSQPLYKEFKIQ
ncbi:hypothetical protein METHP15_470043 [Pseudomonas sp. P15-2025]